MKVKAPVRQSEKLMMWRCLNCGYNNYAPADQTPHNKAVCYGCEKLFEWHEITANLRDKMPSSLREE